VARRLFQIFKPALASEEGDIGFQAARRRSSGSLFRTVLAVLIVLLVVILLDGLFVRLPSEGPLLPSERIGAVHIHTQASDGSGTVPEVMAAARQANLSFLAITDHNVAMTAQDIAEDPPDLPIISGEELSTSAGHFLALGLPAGWERPKVPYDRTLLAAARAAGAFTVIAHPYHPRTPWTDWKTSDFDGMEIWNEDAVWRQNNVLDLLIALLIYPENDQLAMVRLARTPELNFAKWDELLAQRPVVGMCGSDVHAKTKLSRTLFIRFPGYVPSFEVAREHVLLGASAGGGADAARASGAEILEALRHGHSFCALDALYPSSGFSTRVSSAGASGGPGDSLFWAGSGRISITVPAGASRPLIKVFHDGQEIIEKQAWSVDEVIPGPGRYRVEVFLRQPGLTGWRRWTLWAFTNPVYVTDPTAASAENFTAR
jgi:hypothetical protein